MKLGISSYCLDREIEQGRMTLAEAIDWAAAQGAQCMELVPFAFRFDDPATGKIDTQAIAQVKKQARDAGVELCNYSVLADLYHLILRPVQGVPCRYRDLYITRSGTLQRRAEQMLLNELYALQGDQAPAAV